MGCIYLRFRNEQSAIRGYDLDYQMLLGYWINF